MKRWKRPQYRAVKGCIIITDCYLLFGLFIHVALLGMVDWLGYRHLVTRGYDHTLLALALLNVGVICGIYYLVACPLQRRIQLRRAARQQRLQS